MSVVQRSGGAAGGAGGRAPPGEAGLQGVGEGGVGRVPTSSRRPGHRLETAIMGVASSARSRSRRPRSTSFAMISSCTSGGSPASSSSSCVVDISWASSSSTAATCACSSGGSTVLASASAVNVNAERREHDRAGERQAERQPERAGRGVDPGRLADALVGDRRQRVVVELRDEQAEPAAGDDERDRQPPSRVGARARAERSCRARRRAG